MAVRPLGAIGASGRISPGGGRPGPGSRRDHSLRLLGSCRADARISGDPLSGHKGPAISTLSAMLSLEPGSRAGLATTRPRRLEAASV